jgi:hypothetical protein
MNDLTISGSQCSIDCGCSRWDYDSYTFTIESWVTKSNYQDLRNSVRPGAVGELYNILGRPRFYDKSWSAANTLTFTPAAGSLLSKMRRNTTGFCKNIMSSPLEGDKGWIWVKVECFISGTGDL